MSVAIELLHEAVGELATRTGNVALTYYTPGIAAESKLDGSPVTVADKAAEEAARTWLTQRFPTDGIVGEEFGESTGSSMRRWLVDPIDGTKSFVGHVPLWGTLIAVEERGEILAGAAYFPATRELLTSARDCGCWLNGSRASVSAVADMASATVLTTDDRFPDRHERRSRWATLASRARVVRTWGDAYGYMMVATGRADIMVDDIVSPWDAAAVMRLVLEAGGVFTDFSGEATAFGGSAIATNAALANEARSILMDQ